MQDSQQRLYNRQQQFNGRVDKKTQFSVGEHTSAGNLGQQNGVSNQIPAYKMTRKERMAIAIEINHDLGNLRQEAIEQATEPDVTLQHQTQVCTNSQKSCKCMRKK